MNRMKRRIATIAAAGALALPALAACGAAEQAMDCASLTDNVTKVTEAMTTQDAEAMRTAAEDLRTEAEDIGDADLKTAVTDFANTADTVADAMDGSAVPNPDDLTKLTDGASTITDKCSDVTS